MLNLIAFLTLCAAPFGVQGDDRVLNLIHALTLKVDLLRERMPQMNILEQAFKMAVLEERLREMSNKMDALQKKMADVEKILLTNNNGLQSSVSTPNQEPSLIERKLDQYGNKIMEVQNILRSEAREHVAITRSFKGSLEAGMSKIFSKLDTLAKRDHEEENVELIDALHSIRKAVSECSTSTATTRERIDDVFTDLLSEWTTAHRQMREMDVKLSFLKNSSSVPQIDPEEVRVVAIRVRTEFQRLEELEPKVQHAVRVSSDLETATNQNDQDENLKFLSRNLSFTLKGLQDNLEDRLSSTREGLEIIDEFFVEPRQAHSRSLSSTWNMGLKDLLSNVNVKIDQKLQAVGDQVKFFLSTEALNTVNEVRRELERGAEAIRRSSESENLWKQALQEEMVKVKDALGQAGAELKKCTDPPISSRDTLKKELAKKLRDSMG